MTNDDTSDDATSFEEAAASTEAVDSLRHEVLVDTEEIGEDINDLERRLDELRAMSSDIQERAEDVGDMAERALFHLRDDLGAEHDVLTEDVAELGRFIEDVVDFFESVDPDGEGDTAITGDTGAVEIGGQEYEAQITLRPVEDGGDDHKVEEHHDEE